MSAADAAIAASPADAVEVRIVRYRVRPSAGKAASEWLGDAMLGADDGGGGGARHPLRTAAIHWVTASGGTVAVDVPIDERFGPDDVARLLVAARGRGVPCAVWTETDRLGGGSMQLSETWFGSPGAPGADGVGVEAAAVDVQPTSDGAVVTVDEWQPPQRAWLLFYPVMLFSFAWVFFLFLGALPRMLRENWQRAMRGVGQRCVVTLDADALRFHVQRSGESATEIEVPRAALLALGTSLGFTAYTADGAIELPNQWAVTDLAQQQAIPPAIASAINAALARSAAAPSN